ncbi:putative SecY/SEC61-alpha family protein [Rosa chinensis]|uniref:Putative SecY/SEC61-alpha family protein n=1 Tax=Rosa chinensis TaxID=74649 RepID=A0A2P6R4D2_ROSCH|nr:putative SecY/SEC61-alpha family protein [Rosa chinensis]
MLTACAMLSRTWVSGSSTRDAAKKLREQNIAMSGHRVSNLNKKLNCCVPTTAAFGGICIGAWTLLADSMGASAQVLGFCLLLPSYINSLRHIIKSGLYFFRICNFCNFW